MDSINKVILLGAVCNLPKSNNTKTGKTIVSFGLVTEDSTQGENGTTYKDYHRITAMGDYAAQAAEQLRLGDVVYVEGKTKSGKYTDNKGVSHKTADIMAFVVKDFSTLIQYGEDNQGQGQSSGYSGNRSQGSGGYQQRPQQQTSQRPEPPPQQQGGGDDDELPF